VNCNVLVADTTEVCPLCHSVLEEWNGAEDIPVTEQETDANAWFKFSQSRAGAPYPDVRARRKRFRFVLRLLLFVCVLAILALFVVNRTHQEMRWPVVSGTLIVYAYATLMYWLDHDAGRIHKMGVQFIWTFLLVLFLDWVSGFHGWSLSIAMPCIVLFGDALLFVALIADRKQWYSYTMLLVLMAFVSLVLAVLYVKGVLYMAVLFYVAAGVTTVLVLAVLIFGWRGIVRELGRRFRV
jgi:hypothetical protein